MPMLIGVTGKAGSGKDTFANELCNNCLKYSKIAFADPIKEGISAIFSIPMFDLENRVNKERKIAHIGKSPRQLMQLLGTEFGRDLIDRDIWIILARRRINELFKRGISIVITDVRFENEAEMIRNMNGLIVHIERPGIEAVASHISEKGIERLPEDYVIYNTHTIDTLREFAYVVHEREIKRLRGHD
jgi:hypothetical protein